MYRFDSIIFLAAAYQPIEILVDVGTSMPPQSFVSSRQLLSSRPTQSFSPLRTRKPTIKEERSTLP